MDTNHREHNEHFVSAYAAARVQEGWRYSDTEVAKLPVRHKDAAHAEIWRIRQASAQAVVAYLRTRPSGPVLELGCGNGWLAHHIHRHSGAQILGVDIDPQEIAQASRVFGSERLQFECGDIFELDISQRFDHIFVVGAIQYFADPIGLWSRLDALLTPSGEIHVLDSPVYADRQAARQAEERGSAYYSDLGVAQMASLFHRHTFAAFPGFEIQRESWVGRIWRRVRRNRSPFVWLIRRMRSQPSVKGL